MQNQNHPAMQQLMHRGMAHNRATYTKVMQRCADYHGIAEEDLTASHAEQYFKSIYNPSVAKLIVSLHG